MVDGPDGLRLDQVDHLLEVSVGVETAIFICGRHHAVEVNRVVAVAFVHKVDPLHGSVRVLHGLVDCVSFTSLELTLRPFLGIAIEIGLHQHLYCNLVWSHPSGK